MMESEDYWQIAALAEQTAQKEAPGITVQTNERVDPLDDQFGVSQPLTVPAELQDALFGPQVPAEAGGTPSGSGELAVAPLGTFAILDAAKMPGLPEVLEGSDLDYCCLFQGNAATEMRDVAPWIVRLEEGNSLARGLFTKGFAPQELWRPMFGVFLRTRSDLEAVVAHLRRFTIIQIEAGRTYYFRFWDPDLLARYFEHFAKAPSPLQTAFTKLGADPIEVICLGSRGNTRIRTFPTNTTAQTSSVSALTTAELTFFDAYRHRILVEEVVDAMRDAFPDQLADRKGDELCEIGMAVVTDMRRYGFKQSHQLRHLVGWGLFYGRGYERLDPEGTLHSICRSDASGLEKFKLFSRRLRDLGEVLT